LKRCDVRVAGLHVLDHFPQGDDQVLRLLCAVAFCSAGETPDFVAAAVCEAAKVVVAREVFTPMAYPTIQTLNEPAATVVVDTSGVSVTVNPVLVRADTVPTTPAWPLSTNAA
jgi:hypothetical protein